MVYYKNRNWIKILIIIHDFFANPSLPQYYDRPQNNIRCNIESRISIYNDFKITLTHQKQDYFDFACSLDIVSAFIVLYHPCKHLRNMFL